MPPIEIAGAGRLDTIDSLSGPASKAILSAVAAIPTPPPEPRAKVKVWASPHPRGVGPSSESVALPRDQLPDFVLNLLKDPNVQQVTVDLR